MGSESSILKFGLTSFKYKGVIMYVSGVINGKADKAAALPKFSDMLTLFQSGGTHYALPVALPVLQFSWLRPCMCTRFRKNKTKLSVPEYVILE